MGEVNTAKGRAVVQEILRTLAVDYGVAGELQGLVDDRWRDIYRAESQVREMLKLLGAPLGDGPFSAEAAGRALAQLGEDKSHG